MSGIVKSKSNTLTVSDRFITSLSTFFDTIGLEFTDESKRLGYNALSALDVALEGKGKTFSDLEDREILKMLQRVVVLGLDTSAVPKHAYIVLRESKDKLLVTFDIEGEGNDVILRKFGEGVIKVGTPWIVKEGDHFEAPQYEGFTQTRPKWQPKFFSDSGEIRKVLLVCYPVLVRGNDGKNTEEYLIATREQVKISLLAAASQNGAPDELLFEMAKMSVDDILENPKYRDYKVTKEGWNKKTYEANIFGPSYRLPHSRESMIARKMRNHAIRPFPKNFSKPQISEMYRETFDDESYIRKNYLDGKEEVVEKVDDEIENVSNKEKLGSEQPEKPKTTVLKNAVKPSFEEDEPQPKPEPKIVEAEYEEVVNEDTGEVEEVKVVEDNTFSLELPGEEEKEELVAEEVKAVKKEEPTPIQSAFKFDF